MQITPQLTAGPALAMVADGELQKAGVTAMIEKRPISPSLLGKAALRIGAREAQIFPSSTGVIGMPFPTGTILAALPKLVASLASSPIAAEAFSRAIMTTDTRPKLAVASFQAGKREVRLLGIAKGAGMIHPNMATMLAYVFTDAQASPRELRAALARAAGQSFNCISIRSI